LLFFSNNSSHFSVTIIAIFEVLEVLDRIPQDLDLEILCQDQDQDRDRQGIDLISDAAEGVAAGGEAILDLGEGPNIQSLRAGF